MSMNNRIRRDKRNFGRSIRFQLRMDLGSLSLDGVLDE
jgi:hypothetical protein